MHFKSFLWYILLEILFFPYLLAQNVSSEVYNTKYEFTYSFKGPYISNNNKIPFWNHFYDTVPGDAQVRVVPSLRGMHGSVWSKNKFEHKEWQIEVSFRVTGKAVMGADGLAIWYVETPFQAGPVFGSMDRWKGMGILFDSFDNNSKRDNPYISLFVNDGTIAFNHATDGMEQIQHGCQMDFRNRPYPIKAKIMYTDNTLELYIHNGNSLHDFYEFCAKKTDVILPPGYYFGVSAATGGLADDHDVLKFLTWSLTKKNSDEVLSEAEKAKMAALEKLQEEYEKNLKEFNAEQQRFKEQYPEKVKEEQASPEDLFQGRTSTEVKKIFEVQSDIQYYLTSLGQMISIAVQKQEKLLKSLEEKDQQGLGEVAKHYQAENSLTQQKAMFQRVIQLQTNLEALKSTAISISNRIATADTGVKSMESAKFHDTYQRLENIKEYINLIDEETKVIEKRERRAAAEKSCPEYPTPSCTPMSLFVGIAVAEVAIILIYFACRQPSIDPGKKYF